MLVRVPSVEDPSSLRSDPERLWAWAQSAHSQGQSIQEVLTAVYGVDLPAEAYVFHRFWPKDNELPIERFFYPWEILSLGSSRAATLEVNEGDAYLEKRELRRNSDLLPLMSLQASEAVHDGYVIGYALEHLRKGSSVIFGHPDEADGQDLEQLGASLLDVLHEWMTDYLRTEKHQYEAPENRRTASDSSVKNATHWLKELEKLQKKLTENRAQPT